MAGMPTQLDDATLEAMETRALARRKEIEGDLNEIDSIIQNIRAERQQSTGTNTARPPKKKKFTIEKSVLADTIASAKKELAEAEREIAKLAKAKREIVKLTEILRDLESLEREQGPPEPPPGRPIRIK